MKVARFRHTRTPLIVLVGLFCATPGYSLLRLNDGRDLVYVTYTAGLSYDSNIFSASGGGGDYLFNSGLMLEYLRKAGLIGINANASWGFTKFGSFSSEDFATPALGLEFTKSTGRTTGSLTFSATQTSKPDINANVRTDVFNYSTGLALRYPVIERYSLAGNFGYATSDYDDNSTGLADLHSYNAGVDLFYTWTSERDLILGYRYRHGDTSNASTTTDHSVNVGVSGKIFSKLNGTARVGLQTRTAESATGPDETFDGIYASVSSTWTATRRSSFTGTIARDFNTTSTATNTESTTFTLEGQYSVNAKFSLTARASLGFNEYVDAASGGREDTFYTYGFGFNYVLHPHLTVSGSYDYFSNSSSVALSDFDRHTFGLSITSRW